MYKILTLNAISDVIYAQLGEGYAVSAGETQPDAVLVRSASMHDMELPVLKFQKSRGGIQRGKKFVLRLHSRPGKNIQKSGFTRVGISHDSRSLHPSSGAASPDQFPVFLHLTEFFFQGRYPCTDQSSVCLQFLFAGPSGADPASQPGQ